jgi:hypothetical protein
MVYVLLVNILREIEKDGSIVVEFEENSYITKALICYRRIGFFDWNRG